MSAVLFRLDGTETPRFWMRMPRMANSNQPKWRKLSVPAPEHDRISAMEKHHNILINMIFQKNMSVGVSRHLIDMDLRSAERPEFNRIEVLIKRNAPKS
jgi:hypothetical protein